MSWLKPRPTNISYLAHKRFRLGDFFNYLDRSIQFRVAIAPIMRALVGQSNAQQRGFVEAAQIQNALGGAVLIGPSLGLSSRPRQGWVGTKLGGEEDAVSEIQTSWQLTQ